MLETCEYVITIRRLLLEVSRRENAIRYLNKSKELFLNTNDNCHSLQMRSKVVPLHNLNSISISSADAKIDYNGIKVVCGPSICIGIPVKKNTAENCM